MIRLLPLLLLVGCASGPMTNDEVRAWIDDNCHKGAWPRHYPVPDEGHRPAHIIQVPAEHIPLKCKTPKAAACAIGGPGRRIGEIYLPAEDPLRHACHEQAHINGALRCRPSNEHGWPDWDEDCGYHYTVKPEDLEPIWRIR